MTSHRSWACQFVTALVGVAGCSSIGDLANDTWVSAAPLDVRLRDNYFTLAGAASAAAMASAPGGSKARLWAVVSDSQDKCNAFANKITANQTRLHASGDLTSLALSALGTIFHPINTVHALSAGATLSTGATTALDTDLFAKQGFAAFRLALQNTYYVRMSDYVVNLEQVRDGEVDYGAEFAELQTIHSLCALAPVESSILASVSPASSPASGTQGTPRTVPAIPGNAIR